MASFKEIKERINSVRSTRKITSAMKMVSAAKLHKAQSAIGGLLPYSNGVNSIMTNLLSGMEGYRSPLSCSRDVARVAVLLFSSNSSLCGAFNSNVEKEMLRIAQKYAALGNKNVEFYAVGQKCAQSVKKKGLNLKGVYSELIDKPDYAPVADLTEELMKRFLEGILDRVEIVYHHFKNAGSQTLVNEVLLPITLPVGTSDGFASAAGGSVDYILEPSREEIVGSLIPKSIKLKLYTALLDSKASEHAIRVIAMQSATDNADELIDDLTIQYNKSRQAAITAELLDLAGGAME